jgi:uncharacterized iron-regulated membrane protein
MKLPRHVFVSWWSVHAWAGVLAALVLAAMFLGGSVSLFRRDIEMWQDPPAAAIDRAAGDRLARAALVGRKLDGKAVGLSLAGDDQARPVLWLPRPAGQTGEEALYLDPDPARENRRTSRLIDVFFHLHFLWHDDLPIGMFIAGLLGVVFLLAVLTGVAIHLKDMARQMYRVRAVARARTLWSDVHKVLGMWGLPFQIMIALTGAIICVLSVLSPHIGLAVFDGDRAAATAAMSGAEAEPPKPSGTSAEPIGFGGLATVAERALPGMRATYVHVEPWGDAAAVATVYGQRPGHGLYPEASVRLRARDGALLQIKQQADEPIAHQTAHVIYGLHFAGFGGLPLRLLYLVLGLAGWITLLSGNWIWIERRRTRGDGRGAEILARLTIGLGGGMLVAAAAIFWINRLAPAEPGRPALEVYGFFGVWAATAVIAACVPARTWTWAALLAVAGAGLVMVPALSALVGPSYAAQTARFVDLGVGCAGLGCLIAGHVLRHRSARAVVA